MKVPQNIKHILETLEYHGYSAWCVGGCVRDSMLGKTPEDWDITTSALPQECLSIFEPDAFPTGLKHGTVTVRKNQTSVEITTFRTDGTYLDNRHPASVTFTKSLEEDLSRRDFTVNAMAVNLREELEDPFHGQEDLEQRILRCVGNPDRRFNEDALRILRCLRFASTLNFSIDSETAESLRRNRELLLNIAVERIREELTKLLCGINAAAVLRSFPEVFAVVMPEIKPMFSFDQRSRYHCFDVWEHTLHALEAAPAHPVLRWAVLLHDIGKPHCFTLDVRGGHFYGHPAISRELAEGILRRLKFDHETQNAILTLVEWHDRNFPHTEKGMRRALMKLGELRLRQLLDVKRADNLGQAPEYRNRLSEINLCEKILNTLLAENACFSLKQLAVNGNDLIKAGLSGPQIGQALDDLLNAVVDGTLPNEKSALLQAALSKYKPL